MFRFLSIILSLFLVLPQSDGRQSALPAGGVIDDFEAYSDGSLPTRWKMLINKTLVPVQPEHMADNEKFFVNSDDGNNTLRVYSHGEAAHLSMPTDGEFGSDIRWDLNETPVLSWDWRALQLPQGAREDIERLNDSGMGMYVIFSIGGFLVKRPTIIKYVYSSTLPVGTVISYGKLKVVVVSSGKDGIGSWQHIERNVAEDYRHLFGGEPPETPLSLRLWSDSDNTDGTAEGDFDNIVLK